MELSKSDTQAIKGIAILFMLWHHLFLNVTGYGALTHSLALVFKVCVALFLFVSGYGLAKQYGSLSHNNFKTTFKFLLRRFTNFFLSYWFCFFLVVLVGNICGYTFQDAYPDTRNTLKCFIFDAFGQMGYDSYLKPWWFNKMIIQLYLIFPILYFLINNKYTAIVGLFVVFLTQYFARSIPGNLFFVLEGGLPAFYLGMISSRHQFIQYTPKKRWRIVFVSVSVVFIIGLAILHNHITTKDTYLAILLRAVVAYFIVFTYKLCSIRQDSKLVFIGKYATIMYFTHVLLLVLLPRVIYSPSHSLLVFALFAVVCLAIAMIITWLQKALLYDELRSKLVRIINNL